MECVGSAWDVHVLSSLPMTSRLHGMSWEQEFYGTCYGLFMGTDGDHMPGVNTESSLQPSKFMGCA